MRKNASEAGKGFVDAVRWNRVLVRNGQSSLSQVHMRQRNLNDSTQGKRDSRLRAYKADVGWCLYCAELANNGGLRSHSSADQVALEGIRTAGRLFIFRVPAAAVGLPCRINATTRRWSRSCTPATEFC
jgi:antirestriction protein ArdC